ncbi:MAG: peptidylprolyl isomerase [Phycisphaerae bacterium]|nr:peptidylprolyl isomerase [Phycisphaerae bacterium]
MPDSKSTPAAEMDAGHPSGWTSSPRPGPASIKPDILMVDDTVLTADELLYGMRDEIVAARDTPLDTRRAQLANLLRQRAQQEIGTIVLYAEAMKKLGENQEAAADAAVENEIGTLTARQFESSQARFEQHLARYRVTPDQYRALLKREIVAHHYARQNFMPMVNVRRADLLEYYEQHAERFSQPASRELFMIDIPFRAMLPEGRRWALASEDEREQARTAARERIRAAHAALSQQPFEEVAREYSRGLMAGEGGAWGMIGKPLQAPYDEATRQIFGFSPGQCSSPIETERGCFIVKCGEVVAGGCAPFAELQDKIRVALTNERINALSVRYMDRLVTRASVSSLDRFVEAATERAMSTNWPDLN